FGEHEAAGGGTDGWCSVGVTSASWSGPAGRATSRSRFTESNQATASFVPAGLTASVGVQPPTDEGIVEELNDPPPFAMERTMKPLSFVSAHVTNSSPASSSAIPVPQRASPRPPAPGGVPPIVWTSQMLAEPVNEAGPFDSARWMPPLAS